MKSETPGDAPQRSPNLTLWPAKPQIRSYRYAVRMLDFKPTALNLMYFSLWQAIYLHFLGVGGRKEKKIITIETSFFNLLLQAKSFKYRLNIFLPLSFICLEKIPVKHSYFTGVLGGGVG